MKSFRVVLYQITRPLSYLSIKHEDKYLYDWVFPFSILILGVIAAYFLDLNLVDLIRFSTSLGSFVSNLPGFFIAALAAVATFNRKDIDKDMVGERPPTVETLIGDRKVNMVLTRRRFLCMLFSYLTALSIVLSIIGFIPTSFVFFENEELGVSLITVLVYLIAFYMLFFQLIVSTLYGLYYLGDRVHYS
ncbi:hypothetical protein LPL18_011340 [Halomonas sp. CUBES01]|uniref:hypothetical protein n=1 Tax=Halomonas sp. CUBES01 TaxID=2897340 RepID=UPI001E510C0A|nr:hypothetical protein [Halomonas sp. CUBES01]MEC4767918.1 hypothetical protein [Halomonas sp. CUBES01]